MWIIQQFSYGAVFALAFWFVSCCTVGSFSVVYFFEFRIFHCSLGFFRTLSALPTTGALSARKFVSSLTKWPGCAGEYAQLIPKSSHTRRWELRHARYPYTCVFQLVETSIPPILAGRFQIWNLNFLWLWCIILVRWCPRPQTMPQFYSHGRAMNSLHAT